MHDFWGCTAAFDAAKAAEKPKRLSSTAKFLVVTAKFLVVTMGNCGIVRHALQDYELLRYIHGITDDNPIQQTVKVLMDSQFERRLRWD